MPELSFQLSTKPLKVSATLGGQTKTVFQLPAVILECAATQADNRLAVEFKAPQPVLTATTFAKVQPFARLVFKNALLATDAPKDTVAVGEYLLTATKVRARFEVDVARGFFPQPCKGAIGSGGRPLARARYIAAATAKLVYEYKIEKRMVTRKNGTNWVPVAGDPLVHEQGEFTFFPEVAGKPLTLVALESPCQEPALGVTYNAMFPYRHVESVIQISG